MRVVSFLFSFFVVVDVVFFFLSLNNHSNLSSLFGLLNINIGRFGQSELDLTNIGKTKQNSEIGMNIEAKKEKNDVENNKETR